MFGMVGTAARAIKSGEAQLMVAGVILHMARVFFTSAYREAPASTLAPVNYMHIAFATVLGWLVFADANGNNAPDAGEITQTGRIEAPLRVTTLITPNNAFEPYTAPPGPGMYSMRSMRSMSSENSLPTKAWSNTASLTRLPSISSRMRLFWFGTPKRRYRRPPAPCRCRSGPPSCGRC